MRLKTDPTPRALLVFAFLIAFDAHALDITAWKHRQSLAINQPGIVKLALPPATLDLARPNLEDLRLLDPSGNEVPYVLERAAPSAPPTVRAPRAFRVTLLDSETQLLIETGSATPLAAIALTTPAPNFLKAARVELSSDGERWETLETGAPLFRQFGTEQLRLDLARRSASHIRVTINDARAAAVPFTGATLFFVTTAQPPLTTALPIRIAQREEFSGETLLTLDLGARHIRLAELEFTTTEALFVRNVRFAIRELQDEVAVERTLASGSIYRVAADGLAPATQLKVPVDFAIASRELLVHITNHDSPPLTLDEVRAQQRPIWLIFRASAAGAFTLLSDNPDVSTPRYDLASLSSALREVTPSALLPGAPELNPGYRRPEALADTPLLGAVLDPTPWSFRKLVRLAHAGVQQLELDIDVLSQAQRGFADLRLVRERTQIPYMLERPPLSRAVTLTLTARANPKRPNVSRWELKLPRPGLPVARLTLSSSTPLFHRYLRVTEKIGDERGNSSERHLADATWSKTPGDNRTLTLTLAATPATDTLMLETDNGDNPPLALDRVQAHYPVARLLFKVDNTAIGASDSNPIALYYGNRQASAPHYDLNLVAGQILAAEKNVATLAAEEKARSDGWAASALAAARGGPLFWSVLGLVVIVLLVVVAKLLPKPSAPEA